MLARPRPTAPVQEDEAQNSELGLRVPSPHPTFFSKNASIHMGRHADCFRGTFVEASAPQGALIPRRRHLTTLPAASSLFAVFSETLGATALVLTQIS